MSETETGTETKTQETPEFDPGDIEKLVDQKVAAALADLDKTKPEPRKPADREAGPIQSAKTMEDEAARMVREASAKLAKEKEQDDLNKTVVQLAEEAKARAKAEAEQAPKKVRRLTKLLWGNDD